MPENRLTPEEIDLACTALVELADARWHSIDEERERLPHDNPHNSARWQAWRNEASAAELLSDKIRRMANA